MGQKSKLGVVFAFGRWNPPTTGHARVINKAVEIAEACGHQVFIFSSVAHDDENNPLSYVQKIAFLEKLFPKAHFVNNPRITSPFKAAEYLSKRGFTNVTLVAGGDHVQKFRQQFDKYRASYGFTYFKVVDAGTRGPRDISATRQRQFVSQGNLSAFTKFTPTNDNTLAARIFHATRKNLKCEIDESLKYKALFVVGGPGSGKDVLITNLIEGYSFAEVTLAALHKGSGISDRRGLVIAANAYEDKSLVEARDYLKTLGYDTMMVFVSTTEKISAQRSKKWDETRQGKYHTSIAAIPIYESLFGLNRFRIIDNSERMDVASLYDAISRFIEDKQMAKLRLEKGENLDDLFEAVEWGQDSNDTYRRDTPGQPSVSSIAVDGGQCVEPVKRDTLAKMEQTLRLQEIINRAAAKIKMKE